MYPKTFFAANHTIRPETCFVAMPFAKKFDNVFVCIKRALQNANFVATRTDELNGGGSILEDILQGIATSEIIVADLTGRNPNVFYELGIAHLCKDVKKVILVSQDVESIPFDVRTFRNIVYRQTPAGLNSLADKLKQAVKEVRDPVHRFLMTQGRSKAELPNPLLGTDGCMYSFAIAGVHIDPRYAKFRLKVTRSRLVRDELKGSLIINEPMALNLGELKDVGNTEWSIILEPAPSVERPLLRVLRKPASECPKP